MENTSQTHDQEGTTTTTGVAKGVHAHDNFSNMGVALAKILLICFIAEHNLPFSIVDHMINLCKVMFPDSAIAHRVCA